MRGVSIAAQQNGRASGQDRKRTGHQVCPMITLTFLGDPIFTHSREKMSWYGPRSFNSSTPWMCLFSFLLRLTLEAISHFFSGDPSLITLVHPPVLIFYEGRQKTHTFLYHPVLGRPNSIQNFGFGVRFRYFKNDRWYLELANL